MERRTKHLSFVIGPPLLYLTYISFHIPALVHSYYTGCDSPFRGAVAALH